MWMVAARESAPCLPQGAPTLAAAIEDHLTRYPTRRAQSTTTGDEHPDGQPTEPSIWSSIKRLHSTAYSIGSVRVIGSMKPFTTMPIACSSERPRLIR